MLYIKLRYLREKANLSRKELADLLNISYNTISKYETNERQPDLRTLRSIARIFNVTTDYLLEVPFGDDVNREDLFIHFELIKSIIKNSDQVYFNENVLTDTSKSFVLDSIDYISNQIENINENS